MNVQKKVLLILYHQNLINLSVTMNKLKFIHLWMDKIEWRNDTSPSLHVIPSIDLSCLHAPGSQFRDLNAVSPVVEGIQMCSSINGQ